MKRSDWKKIFSQHRGTVERLARGSSTIAELVRKLNAEIGENITQDGLCGAWKRYGMTPSLSELFVNTDKKVSLPNVPDMPEAPPEITPEEKAAVTLEAWRRKQSAASDRQASQALASKVHELENQLSVALDTKAGMPALPSVKHSVKKRPEKRMEATAVVLASDWHIEEKVDPAAVNGHNEYNLDISRQRAEKFFRGTLWLLEHNRNGFDIDNLVLWLGGDLISGYIHEELEESNFLAPPEAILYAMDLLIGGIDLLLKEGKLERIIVPCNRGNHGRIHKKRRVSTASANSFEWMMYRLLKMHYKDEPRIEFMVADGDHLYLDVYKYTIRFMHGDTFNYGGGVGGMVIPIRRGLQRLQQFQKADITCLGHFHTYGDYGDIVANGSLIGYSPYALSIAASYEPPQQAFFLIEPEHGKCQNTPIWLK